MEDRYWRRSVKLMTTQAARKMARSRAGKDMPVGFRQNSNRIFCFKTAKKAASSRLNIDSGKGAEAAVCRFKTADQCGAQMAAGCCVAGWKTILSDSAGAVIVHRQCSPTHDTCITVSTDGAGRYFCHAVWRCKAPHRPALSVARMFPHLSQYRLKRQR